MRTPKLISDITSAVIVGDLVTPYKLDRLSFYHEGNKISIYFGNTQIVELMLNEGGVIGNIDNTVLNPQEEKMVAIFKGIFKVKDNDEVSVIPISELRKTVDKYTTRYSYDSVLASLYKYYDSTKIDDIHTLYDNWLETESNPVLDLVIDNNNWSDELQTDISKYMKG